jgi:hypothetical protein
MNTRMEADYTIGSKVLPDPKRLGMIRNPNTGEYISIHSPEVFVSYSSVYNPKTRQWEQQETYVIPKVESSESTDSDNPYSIEEPPEPVEIPQISHIILEGEVEVLPVLNTIKIESGDTVIINGIGKHLSGKYFVTQVDRTLSSGGYTQRINVQRTGFKTENIKGHYADEASGSRVATIEKLGG